MEQIKLFIERLPWIVKNKYVLTILLFLCFITLIPRHNLLSQWRLNKQLKVLEDKKKHYLTGIAQIKENELALTENERALEKFAREKYFMKRDNEDVFIIQEIENLNPEN